MGAKNSTLSFDTGIKVPRKRRTSYRCSNRHSCKKSHIRNKSYSKKNPYPNMPFHKPHPFPNIPFPNIPGNKKSSKKHHHRRSHRYTILPKGNWINTAKDYYVINNILYAKLRTKSGNYKHAQIVFFPNQRFQNKDGRFALLY